jgi:antitoxin HicB
MEAEHLSKTQMAILMDTSRSALGSLIDPKNAPVIPHTLDNAARAVGKILRIKLS